MLISVGFSRKRKYCPPQRLYPDSTTLFPQLKSRFLLPIMGN